MELDVKLFQFLTNRWEGYIEMGKVLKSNGFKISSSDVFLLFYQFIVRYVFKKLVSHVVFELLDLIDKLPLHKLYADYTA